MYVTAITEKKNKRCPVVRVTERALCFRFQFLFCEWWQGK